MRHLLKKFTPDHLAPLLGLLTFFTWLGILTAKYFNFGYFDWDLALSAQTMWQVSHGAGHNSLMGIHFLGNHANFFAFLLAPLYFALPHPLTLIALKIASLSTAAILLYTICRRHFSWALSLTIMILYLSHPANVYALLFEFDFENLALVFIFLLFYFHGSKNLKGFMLTAFFLALIKENMPLIVIAFGFYGLFCKDRPRLKWAVLPAILGALIFILGVFIVTPQLRQNLHSPHAYIGLYSHLTDQNAPGHFGPASIITKFFEKIFESGNVEFLAETFAPFLPSILFAPMTLLLGLPILMQNLLSSSRLQHTIYFHYAATLLPFIFLAAIQGLYFFRKISRPLIYRILLCATLFLPLINFSKYQETFQKDISGWQDKEDPARQALLRLIPEHEPVLATFAFLPSLSQRPEVYSFHNVWRGFNQITGQSPVEIPAHLTFALIDFTDHFFIQEFREKPKAISSRIREFLDKGRWQVQQASGNIVLFRRGIPETQPLVSWEKVSLEMPPAPLFIVDQHFSLLDYTITPVSCIPQFSCCQITLRWAGLTKIDDLYTMGFFLENAGGTRRLLLKDIGTPIYPTVSWETNMTVTENITVAIPPDIPAGNYILTAQIYVPARERIATLTSGDRPTEEILTIKLGEIKIAGSLGLMDE